MNLASRAVFLIAILAFSLFVACEKDEAIIASVSSSSDTLDDYDLMMLNPPCWFDSVTGIELLNDDFSHDSAWTFSIDTGVPDEFIKIPPEFDSIAASTFRVANKNLLATTNLNMGIDGVAAKRSLPTAIGASGRFMIEFGLGKYANPGFYPATGGVQTMVSIQGSVYRDTTIFSQMLSWAEGFTEKVFILIDNAEEELSFCDSFGRNFKPVELYLHQQSEPYIEFKVKSVGGRNQGVTITYLKVYELPE